MIWTVPNLLTMARIAAAPGVALAFVALPRPAAGWVAFGLFVAAALTDFLDGWLARRLGQESALGRMLDPIADKAMVVTGLFALAGIGFGGEWLFVVPATAILLREVLVSGLREFLGDIKLPVTRLAKWKTTLQMAAIGGFLFLVPFHASKGEACTYQHISSIIQSMDDTELEARVRAYASGKPSASLCDSLASGVRHPVFAALEGWMVILLWLAAILTLVTGWDYFRKGLAYIGRREDAR